MGHWYTTDGKPAHFTNGRDTTLRDARKLGLLPSVSEIIRQADRPALTNWMVEQAMDACLTLPRLDHEPLDAFKMRAREDSRKQSEKAREAGNALHEALEARVKGLAVSGQWIAHVDAFEAKFPLTGFEAETTFASPLGYGGMCDLSRDDVVADYKSKANWKEGAKLAYAEHGMQLAAYREGLKKPNARLLNIFISTEEPGKFVIHEWTEDDNRKHFEMFLCLLRFWRLSKGYAP